MPPRPVPAAHSTGPHTERGSSAPARGAHTRPVSPPPAAPGRPAFAATSGAPRLVAPALDATAGRDATDSGASLVLRTLLRQGPLARGALAKQTGLSPAAVSRHTAALLDLGLLRARADAASTRPRAGRPEVPVDVDTEHFAVCGVHLAMDHITYGLIDLRGRVLVEERHRHSRDVRSVLQQLTRQLPEFLTRRVARRSLLGIGVVTGGRVDPARGVIVEQPVLGWREVPLRDELSRVVRLPVFVDGHARALARAELLYGMGTMTGELVHLFVGNVVDAAIASCGQLLTGHRFGAGEVAHLPVGDPGLTCSCGRSGCLEPTVALWRLAEVAFEQGVVPVPDRYVLMQAAQDGVPEAVAIYRERLRVLARAVGLLLDLLNPELFVVTEFALMQLPALRGEFHAEVAAHSRWCPDPAAVVRPTSFPDQPLSSAAGAVVLDLVHRHPLRMRVAAA